MACLRYQLVKDPFEVLVEESPYFNSPRFEDPNEKIPSAKEGDIVKVLCCVALFLASLIVKDCGSSLIPTASMSLPGPRAKWPVDHDAGPCVASTCG